MLKNRKLLLSVIVAILLLAVAGFFIWKDLKSKPTNKEIGGGGTIVNIDNPNGIVKEISSGEIKTDTELSNQMPDLSKTIIVKNNLTLDIENIYRAKIAEQISALKADNMDFDGWLNLGGLRKAVGDYDGAIEAWEYANVIAPNSFIIFNNLGDLYGFNLKNLPEAEENYLKAIEALPQNSAAYVSLADLYWYDKPSVKQDRIEKLLERGVVNAAGGQDKSNIFLRFAKYYEDIKDYANAIKYDELFMKEGPANAGNTAVQEKLIELQRQ